MTKKKIRQLKAQVKSFTGYNDAELARWWQTVHPVIGISPFDAEKNPKIWRKFELMVNFSNTDLGGDFKPTSHILGAPKGDTPDIDW